MNSNLWRRPDVKPGVGILLNYFSLCLNDLSMLRPVWAEMKNKYNNNYVSSGIFYLFGYSDILVLGISDDSGKLDEMQNMNSYRKMKGVMDFFSHYGVVICVYPKPFSFGQEIEKNPIIGTIAVKVRLEAWDKIFKELSTFEKLQKKFEEKFKEAVVKTAADCEPLDSSDYKAVLLLSYGTEDGLIVFFTRSFEYIKRFSTNLRTLELSDLIPKKKANKMKHIVVSTNTILGARLSDKFIIEIPTNNYDRISWSTLFQIRPGHLQYAINKIKNLLELKKYKMVPIPTVGRNDLVIHSTRPYRLKEFLETHSGIISKLWDDRSVLSTETCISFPNLDEIESPYLVKKLYSKKTPKFLQLEHIYKAVRRSKYLNILERESFIQILRKLEYLLREDYLRDYFVTLIPVIKKSLEEYSSLTFQEKQDHPRLDLLVTFIESCYATRYQGNPPVGETAVCPTLGFYTVGVKLLVMLDYVGNRIIRQIANSCDKDVFNYRYFVTTNITSVTAANVPLLPLPISFILLPAKPLFRPEITLVTFFHELGHVVFQSFCCSKSIDLVLSSIPKRRAETLSAALDSFEEVFADFFLAKVLFDSDFMKFQKMMKKILNQFRFRVPVKEFVSDLKKSHADNAEKLAVYLKNGRNKFSTEIFPKPFKDIMPYLNKFLNSILRLDDPLVEKMHYFLACKNQRESFWDLWIYSCIIRNKAYYFE